MAQFEASTPSNKPDDIDHEVWESFQKEVSRFRSSGRPTFGNTHPGTAESATLVEGNGAPVEIVQVDSDLL